MATRRKTVAGRVAITGAAGGLGRAVVTMLAAESTVHGVVAVDGRADVSQLSAPDERVVAHRVDLTDPTSGTLLGEVLRRRGVSTVVHAAFSQRPRQDPTAAHELEVIGTLQVLTACAAARVRNLILLSSTMAYGASPQNPNHLAEDAPLRGSPGFGFVQDKVEAEAEVARFVASRRGLSVTVLRFAPLLGPHLDTLWSRYMRMPAAPTVLGRDPLMQFVHPLDALRAIRLTVLTPHAGAFNVVGRGVVPLSTALRMAGSVALPLPSAGTRALLGTLWAAGTGALPSQALDYLRYLCVADGAKAASMLGFIPQFGVQEAIVQLVAQRASVEVAHG
jgi:UDP-glucose 4-epimerase